MSQGGGAPAAAHAPDQAAALSRIEQLLGQMSDRIALLEGGGAGLASAVPALADVAEDALLNTSLWSRALISSDIQRTALMTKLRTFYLKKCEQDRRQFDLRQGECLLRILEKVLQGMAADAVDHGEVSGNQQKVCAKILEELLSLKVLAEDGTDCQRYFDAQRLAKTLPDDLKKIYADTKAYRRQIRQSEIAGEAGARGKRKLPGGSSRDTQAPQ